MVAEEMHGQNEQNSPKAITSPGTSPRTSPRARSSPKIRDFKINRNKSRRERNEEHFK